MAKPKYTEAKNRIKKLFYIVPLINSRMALRYLEKSDLPKDQIPKDYTTIRKWFNEFEKVSDRTRQVNLMNFFDDINLEDINFIVDDDEIIQLRKKEK